MRANSEINSREQAIQSGGTANAVELEQGMREFACGVYSGCVQATFRKSWRRRLTKAALYEIASINAPMAAPTTSKASSSASLDARVPAVEVLELVVSSAVVPPEAIEVAAVPAASRCPCMISPSRFRVAAR